MGKTLKYFLLKGGGCQGRFFASTSKNSRKKYIIYEIKDIDSSSRGAQINGISYNEDIYSLGKGFPGHGIWRGELQNHLDDREVSKSQKVRAIEGKLALKTS